MAYTEEERSSLLPPSIQHKITNKRLTNIYNTYDTSLPGQKTGLPEKNMQYYTNNEVLIPTISTNNGNFTKLLKYGNGICNHNMDNMADFYNNINNNKEEVKQIINTINTNMGNCLNLSNGNILLYKNQLKISNKNMEEVINKLKIVNNNIIDINNNINNNINMKIDKTFDDIPNNHLNN
eukprot:378813_1